MATISRETAANVLHHFQGEGFPGGSFTEALLVAIAKADQGNRALLGKGFPELVTAMEIAMNYPDGLDFLRGAYRGGS